MSFAADLKDFVKTFTAIRQQQSTAGYYQYLRDLAAQKAAKGKGKSDESDNVEKAAEWGRRRGGFGSTAVEGRSAAGPKPVGGFDQAMDRTLDFEGRGDKAVRDNNGALVKYGINQAANPDVDVANLTPDAARDIYKTRYWDPINGDELAKNNPALAHVAFDAAVNHGPGKAREFIAAANGDPYKLLAARQAHYDSLANTGDPKYGGNIPQVWADRNATLRADLDNHYGQAPDTATAALPVPSVNDVPLPPARPDNLGQALPVEAGVTAPVAYNDYALPIDPYNTEAVYSSTGGVVPSFTPRGVGRVPFGGVTTSNYPAIPRRALGLSGGGMVQHFAAGGLVGDDDEEDSPTAGATPEERAYQALSLTDLAQGGGKDDEPTKPADPYAGVKNAIGGLPFGVLLKALPDALHDGLTQIQKAYDLPTTQGAVPSDGQRRFAARENAADPQDFEKAKDLMDPEHQANDSLRSIAGLSGVYEYYMRKGEPDKAAKVAASIIEMSQHHAEQYGTAALNANSPGAAAKIVAEGYNKSVLDGHHMDVDENGNYQITDVSTGEVVKAGRYSPADVLKAATALRDPNAYYRELSRMAGRGKKAGGPGLEDVTQGLSNIIEGAAPAPPPGAPQVTPAGTQAVPTTPPTNAPMQEGRTAGTTAVVPNASAATEMPVNFIDSLPTAQQKAAFRRLQIVNPSRANAYEAEYQRNLLAKAARLKAAQEAQSPDDVPKHDEEKIAGAVDTAMDEHLKALKDKDGNPLPPPPVAAQNDMKYIARSITKLNENTSSPDAVDAVSRITSFAPDGPIPMKTNKDGTKVPDYNAARKMLPFTTGTNKNGPYVRDEESGEVMRVSPAAQIKLLKMMNAKIDAYAAKQAEAGPSAAEIGRNRMIQGYGRMIEPSPLATVYPNNPLSQQPIN